MRSAATRQLLVLQLMLIRCLYHPLAYSIPDSPALADS